MKSLSKKYFLIIVAFMLAAISAVMLCISTPKQVTKADGQDFSDYEEIAVTDITSFSGLVFVVPSNCCVLLSYNEDDQAWDSYNAFNIYDEVPAEQIQSYFITYGSGNFQNYYFSNLSESELETLLGSDNVANYSDYYAFWVGFLNIFDELDPSSFYDWFEEKPELYNCVHIYEYHEGSGATDPIDDETIANPINSATATSNVSGNRTDVIVLSTFILLVSAAAIVAVVARFFPRRR